MRDYKDKSEFFTLMMCLPALHLSTSKMFSSLLYWYVYLIQNDTCEAYSLLFSSGQEMMRHSKLFSRILLRLLSEHKHKRTLKSSVYKLISLCLEKCGYAFAESMYKPLIAAILQDMRIIEHKAASIEAATSQKKSSHKKRRTDVTNSDALSNKLVSAASTDVQVAALQTLATLLDVFGFAMENGQRAAVDGTVLTRLIQVIHPTDMTNEDVVLVKAELYNCLIASVTHPIETQASILPHATRLFSAGINDQSHELQRICKKGLGVCDLIMHARLPPVQRVLPKAAPAVVITAQEIEEEEDVVEEEETIVEEQIPEAPREQIKEIKPVETPVSVPITPVTLPAVEKSAAKEPVSEKVTIPVKPVDDMAVPSTEPVPVSKEIPPPLIPTNLIDLPTANTVTSSTAATIDSTDEDMDMDMPMIDMAGPDSDEEEEE
jgi:hypothetical protein